jgi:signal transduction histidine kinase/CheY-like chemotaxis protein
MRSWSIRTQLLTIPVAAAVVIGATAWLSAVSADHRIAWGLVAFDVLIVFAAIALAVANNLTARVTELRQQLACLADPEAPAEGGGDELDALSEALEELVYRGQERETELRRTSEFLRFVQHVGGFGIFELDLESAQIEATPLFFNLIGVEPLGPTFTRHDWLATIHPEDFESVIHALSHAIEGGPTVQAEYRTLLQDGSVRWLATRGEISKDPEGSPMRLIGTVADITERKHLEASLRQKTESLNIAQNAAGVATMDLNFHRRSWISSDNLYEMLAIPPTTQLNDLNGRLASVHPEDLERARRAPFETDPAHPAYACEYRVLLPEGGERWIAEKADVAHGRSGEILRITGALIDVTDRKRTEADRQLAEQAALDAKLAAETANRAKSNFLANVSHEIRTPMNGVIGMAQILSDTLLDATQREYVDIIRGSAGSLLSLLNDVLDLSKIEADRLELEQVDYDLRDVVYDTAAATALQAAVKGIELVVDIDADVPVLARGDPVRLRQIIMNLIGNAQKFTHEGHILLKISCTNGNGGNSVLKIEVSDTGIGIPADRLDRLFKSFSQVDSSTTRHYGGTGLGLSIVKQLVKLMGGDVRVESEVGRGSKFSVTLPASSPRDQGGPSPLGAGRKVLIVDDLAASRSSLVTKLQLFSFEPIAVASVDEALARLAAGERVDCVVADELMPGKGGLELLTALRSDPRHARLPFVLLSLFGADHGAVREGAFTPNALGLKPIRAYNLAKLIEKALSDPAEPGIEIPQLKTITTFRGSRILLVEDNPVNQRVASRLLQKLAVDVVLANHGAEALERIAEGGIDAVLMDCQMPVMDGFTATARIRERERAEGLGKRLPIIALTANVMTEDREHCIAAGMDAHIGKPIVPTQLADCLSRYVGDKKALYDVDVTALHELTGGDAEFERELIDTFVASGDKCLKEILEAVRTSDFDTVGKRAHALKGASANIHAHRLAAAASNLELAARSNSLREIGSLVHQVKENLQAVNAQLRKVG